MNVASLFRRAASTAAAQLRMVPPTQKPSTCIRSAPVISRDDIDRLQRSDLEIIVPGQMLRLGDRAAPGDQKHVMALRHGIFDERIAGAEIER